MLKHYRTVLIIGIIEILIGGITLSATFYSLVAGTNNKSPGVLLFVVIAATLSTMLGIGMMKYKRTAYMLLLYFSSVVFLSKILIFLDVIRLTGAMETTVPSSIKNIISVLYHGFVIYYLQKDEIQEAFHISTK